MTDPAHVIRAALAARELIQYPILAWIAGVPAAAILWGVEVRILFASANVLHDPVATARVLTVALDIAQLDREMAATP